MELIALKYGDLMGSPDVKDLLLAAGPGSDHAHRVWQQASVVKWSLGWTGHGTSALLVDESRPEVFPAWVDPSWVTPDPASHGLDAVDAGLTALAGAGYEPGDVRSVLLTHEHMDHADPRLLARLTAATIYGPQPAVVPGPDGQPARPFDADRFGDAVLALDTPGHGGPHSSYVIDLPDLDAALCIAGDLLMSHAHALSLDHPLAFTHHAAARASVRAVLDALDARGRRHALILPGHDRPFFVTDTLRERVAR